MPYTIELQIINYDNLEGSGKVRSIFSTILDIDITRSVWLLHNILYTKRDWAAIRD